METIAIIGVGLIGGSLGMALKKNAPGRYRVIGIGRDKGRLRLAKRRGAADEVSTDVRAAAQADVVVVCTPVDVIGATLRALAPHLKRGAVVTDAGSVKGSVERAAARNLKGARAKKAFFVGAHPMAGSEKAGVTHASPSLYRGATVVLTYGKGTPRTAVRKVAALWQAAGGRTLAMSAADHDAAVARISHLPHVLAFSLCAEAGEYAAKGKVVGPLAAGSFRDLTRIAASNPRDWAAICSANAAALGTALEHYIKRLETVRERLGQPGALEKMFSSAQEKQKQLLKSGIGN